MQVASVCPPSVGVDGRPRAWNGVWRIAPFPEPLLQLLAQSRRGRSSRPPVPRPPSGARPGTLGERYVQVALAREIEIVRDAVPGQRNRTLNRAAFNFGQLVGSGSLAREAVEEALRDAAFSVGLGEPEIESTLRSGLEAGERSPRTPPPEDDGRGS